MKAKLKVLVKKQKHEPSRNDPDASLQIEKVLHIIHRIAF